MILLIFCIEGGWGVKNLPIFELQMLAAMPCELDLQEEEKQKVQIMEQS